MDDFLTKLYEDEMSKTASIARQEVTDQFDTDELEAMLGIRKVAVAGTPEAPLPSSLPNKALEAKMKEKADYVEDEREGEAVPPEKQPQGSVNYQGQSKVGSADRMGRIMAKVAVYKQTDNVQHVHRTGVTPVSPGMGAVKGGTQAGLLGAALGAAGGTAVKFNKRRLIEELGEAAVKSMPGPRKAALMGALSLGALGAGGGATLSALKRMQIKSDRAQIAKMNKEKNSMGDMEDGGMESTAAAKAKIAMRLLRIVEGAPSHIKTAAIHVAGRELAKKDLAKKVL